MELLLRVGIGLLSIFFILAGSIKIFGWQKTVYDIQVKTVAQYGINPMGLQFIGMMEIFGAVSIWFVGHWIAPFGALVILTASLGAIICHLIWDTWRQAIPAFITALLSAFITWIIYPPLFELMKI